MLCFKINAQTDAEFSLRRDNSSSIPYTVHTLTVLPQYPAINTPIKILVLVTSGTAVSKTSISYNLNLQQNIIDIKACYYCFPATVPSYVKDTVNIGLLPAGTYTVNLKTYRTNSQTVCINKIDSTAIIDTSFTVSSNVGINKNIAAENFVSVYPNPVKDKLTIDVENKNAVDINFSLTNSLGQLINVNSKTINTKLEIDTSELPTGIYYLKVQNNLGQRVFKVIKE
jgi:hypothetical protein